MADKSKVRLSKKQIELIADKFKPVADQAKDIGLKFVAVGRTGVGKSSTVNSLLGEQIAPVGHFERLTATVEEYNASLQGIPCTISDTPGFCDEKAEKNTDQAYLNLLISKVPEFHCMLFVTQLNFSRVDGCEKNIISNISTALGVEVWSHSVVVFTHSNDQLPQSFSDVLKKRTQLIRDCIAESAGSEIASGIPTIAVDNLYTKNPDGKPWLPQLYMGILRRIRQEALVGYVIATGLERIDLNEEDLAEVRSSVESDETFKVGLASIYFGVGPGVVIGAAIGGPIGGAIGAILGPLIAGKIFESD